MSDPAQRVEATPREIFYLPRQGYAGQQPAVWLDDWRRILQRAETAERAFTLAQTENAGHIRIEDELKTDLERERMKVVGCSVAALGNWKEGDSLHADYDCVAIRDVAKLRAKFDEAQARCAELEKDAARYRWLQKQNGYVLDANPYNNDAYIDASIYAGKP